LVLFYQSYYTPVREELLLLTFSIFPYLFSFPPLTVPFFSTPLSFVSLSVVFLCLPIVLALLNPGNQKLHFRSLLSQHLSLLPLIFLALTEQAGLILVDPIQHYDALYELVHRDDEY